MNGRPPAQHDQGSCECGVARGVGMGVVWVGWVGVTAQSCDAYKSEPYIMCKLHQTYNVMKAPCMKSFAKYFHACSFVNDSFFARIAIT